MKATPRTVNFLLHHTDVSGSAAAKLAAWPKSQTDIAHDSPKNATETLEPCSRTTATNPAAIIAAPTAARRMLSRSKEMAGIEISDVTDAPSVSSRRSERTVAEIV